MSAFGRADDKSSESTYETRYGDLLIAVQLFGRETNRISNNTVTVPSIGPSDGLNDGDRAETLKNENRPLCIDIGEYVFSSYR